MSEHEWEFDSPPDQVDLPRLIHEVSTIPAVFALSYMNQLRIKAPKIYALLRSKDASGPLECSYDRCGLRHHLTRWWNWEQKEVPTNG